MNYFVGEIKASPFFWNEVLTYSTHVSIQDELNSQTKKNVLRLCCCLGLVSVMHQENLC